MSTTPDPRADDTRAEAAKYVMPDPDGDLIPLNWLTLSAQEAKAAFFDLNEWVNWLRHAYGLPPTIIPPFWHRHDELIWELSALHGHWLYAYDEAAPPSAPSSWHRDFAETRNRLREWVAACGTRLDRDRPTRQTPWPGEPVREPEPESVITNRDQDFVAFVAEDASRRVPDWTSCDVI